MGIKAKPTASLDEALVKNYELGIIAGMRLAVAMPGELAKLEQEAFMELLQKERMNGTQ